MYFFISSLWFCSPFPQLLLISKPLSYLPNFVSFFFSQPSSTVCVAQCSWLCGLPVEYAQPPRTEVGQNSPCLSSPDLDVVQLELAGAYYDLITTVSCPCCVQWILFSCIHSSLGDLERKICVAFSLKGRLRDGVSTIFSFCLISFRMSPWSVGFFSIF